MNLDLGAIEWKTAKSSSYADLPGRSGVIVIDSVKLNFEHEYFISLSNLVLAEGVLKCDLETAKDILLNVALGLAKSRE